MIEITGLDHIVLRTSRMEEMLHFYTAVLGCPVERELPPEVGLVQLRAGSALIDLVAVDSELGRAGGGPPTQAENNMDHFCLQVKAQPEQEPQQGVEAGSPSRGSGLSCRQFVMYILPFLTVLALLLAFHPRVPITPDRDLTMDFEKMPYLHHNPDGVSFKDWRMVGYSYSSDTVTAGETLWVTLEWEAMQGDLPLVALDHALGRWTIDHCCKAWRHLLPG